MAQFARPDADQAAGGWTTAPLFSKVDEGATGDDVVITSSNNTSPDNADLRLSDVSDPVSSSGHVLRAQWNKDASGGHTINAVLELWEGVPGTGTLRATLTVSGIGNTPQTDTYTLSGSEADSISDYTNLYLRVSRQGDTGGPGGNRRSLVVDFCELEVPDAPVGGGSLPPSTSRHPLLVRPRRDQRRPLSARTSLRPGADSIPMTLLDDFNRANENPLSLDRWAITGNNNSSLQIVSNQLTDDGAYGGNGWKLHRFLGDFRLRWTFVTWPNSDMGVSMVHTFDDPNHKGFTWTFNAGGPNWQFNRIDGSDGPGQAYGVTGFTPVAGDVITFERIGNRFRVYQNGTPIKEHNDSNYADLYLYAAIYSDNTVGVYDDFWGGPAIPSASNVIAAPTARRMLPRH